MKNVRRILVVAAALAVAGALALALRPAAVEVETAVAARGAIRVTVEGTGRTRVRDLFAISAPVPGHLLRIALREGDAVRAGQPVAVVVPAAPALLDARTRRELAARLAGARAAEGEARAAEARARIAADQAERDHLRAAALAVAGSSAASDTEAAAAARSARQEEARMASAAARRAAADAEGARAALASTEGAARGERVVLRSPIDGRVLRVQRESEGPVAAGAPLLEVGDPASLEVDLELLTADAVRIRPGSAVEVLRWGGETALEGTVARVDPAAYTKVSALGVEEQRVHVVVVPAGSDGWARLGDAFAVDARVVLAERADALRVPASALFRDGAGWAAFVVEGGRARHRAVAPAELGELDVAVSSGVAEGERVVLHPTDELADGVRVTLR